MGNNLIMSSVLVYESPMMREVVEYLAIEFLNDFLENCSLLAQVFYTLKEKKVSDCVINDISNGEATKLVQVINKSENFCAKVSKSIDNNLLVGPVK